MSSGNWKLVSLSFVAFFVLAGITAMPVVHAASLVTQVGTHVTPLGVAYDPRTNQIFVSNYQSGDVQVISDSNNTQVADVTNLPGTPYNMVYDSGKSEMWVAGSTDAFAISDATDQIVANVTTHAPESWGTLTQVAYDPKTGEVFASYTDFTGASTPYIQVISDSSDTVIANITHAVVGVVDDSAKGEVFASQYLDSSGLTSGNVSVISTKTNTVTGNIPVGGIPGLEAYDSGKGEVFVANSVYNSSAFNYYSSVIEVISDGNNKVVATIDLPASVSPGPMAYNPNKGEIYINDGASVAIISDATNRVIGTVSTNGTASSSGGIAFDSGTNAVYAVNGPGSASGAAVGLAVISDPSSGTSTTGVTTSTPAGTSASSTTTPTSSSASSSTSASVSSSSSSSSLSLGYLAVVGVLAVVVLATVPSTARRAR
ncbi:MAG: hypothetical protein ABSF83_14165 [Nitrososphaerales archaeon]